MKSSLTVLGIDFKSNLDSISIPDMRLERFAMTTLIKRKLHESISSIASNPNQPRNDLARFAGLWTQAQLREFQAATKPFSRVDKKLWR